MPNIVGRTRAYPVTGIRQFQWRVDRTLRGSVGFEPHLSAVGAQRDGVDDREPYRELPAAAARQHTLEPFPSLLTLPCPQVCLPSICVHPEDVSKLSHSV